MPPEFDTGASPTSRSRRCVTSPGRRQCAGALAAMLLLAAAFAWAQTLEIIELRNRPAEQLLPLIQPLLSSGGSASGSGFQLIVRTTPANLAQIRQVVASLDRAQRQLIVHVRQSAGASASSAGVGATVTATPGNSEVRARAWDNTATAQDNVQQQVRVQEGGQAFISAGTSTLVRQRSVTRTVNGVVVQDTAVPRDYNTGFYVTLRLSGQTVFLDIGTERSTPLGAQAGLGAAAAATSRVASTVSGRLGEWIELGGVNRANSGETSGILARSSDAGMQERRVQVRVEEAR